MLRFSGGEVIEVALALAEVRELVQQAIADGVLLELQAPDGRTLVINPHQVQILQDAANVAPVNGAVSGPVQMSV
jgi:hypothetical protein